MKQFEQRILNIIPSRFDTSAKLKMLQIINLAETRNLTFPEAKILDETFVGYSGPHCRTFAHERAQTRAGEVSPVAHT